MGAAPAALSIALVAALGGPAEPVVAPTLRPAAAPIEVGEGAGSIAAIRLTSTGIDHAALVDAVALRLPELRAIAGDEGCAGECVDVRVRGGEASEAVLEARLSDGRVFVRVLAVGEVEPERRIATSLAHLIAAIVDGSAAPVEGPQAPIGATTPEDPSDPGARDDVDTAELAAPGPSRVHRRAPPAIEWPHFELGVALGLAGVFGVGPPRELGGWSSGGGSLRVELRSPGGVLVSVGARLTEARADGYRLGRARLSIAAGYGYRRGLFEFRALAAVTAEPWWVTRQADGARTTSGAPLLGGALALIPGFHVGDRPGTHAHAGLRIEAAASAPPAAPGAIQVNDPRGAGVFRLGGFELVIGAEISGAFDLRRPPRRPPKKDQAATP